MRSTARMFTVVALLFGQSAILNLNALADASAQPLTVRVQSTAGGPQIHVNGEPVPPRFFWGTENGGRIAVGPEWSSHSFEFTPDTDVPGNDTLHFRFGDTPGEVWLADLRVIEVQSNEDVLLPGSFDSEEAFKKIWNVWPVGADNSVGKLEFADKTVRATPTGGNWADFHLYSRAKLAFAKGKSYCCSFRAKASEATQLTPVVYRVDNGVYTRIGGAPGTFYTQIALARDAGVNFVSFQAPTCWAPPDQAQDWAPVDILCQRIIAVNPKVLLVPRFSADAPGWWLERHPEARMVYDGKTVHAMACVSDRAYRADMSAHLEKLSRHLCEAFPQHFAGLHPCGQNTGEWFYSESWRDPLSGYDPATRVAFREWLALRGDLEAATAEPPTAEARRAHPNGFLRDPARERRLIDFALFQQEEMADHVLALAAACRRGTGGQKLVLFFYGYCFEFPPLGNGAPTSGHYAMGKVLKQGKADIDILCSPISYFDRDWLGTAPVMSAAESVTRGGILWLNEDDSRTFLDLRKKERVQEGGVVNLQQTQQVMLRNTAQAALRGFGTWWMDLPGQGWFNDAAIWREMVRLRPVDKALAQRETPFTPEIAAIIDENSMCHLTGGSGLVARPLIYEGRAALGRCGAPYGQYLLTDLLAGNLASRMQIFLAAWRLTPAQRQRLSILREAEAASDVMRVWCWAPGYLYEDRVDVAGIQEVTGFRAKPAALPTAKATPTELGRQHGLTEAWGPPAKIEPLFSVEAGSDEVWASFADGSPAVAVRRSKAGYDVFVGVPQLTPELVHGLAQLAGVHLYAKPGVALWAANGYLSVQAHTNASVVLDSGSLGLVSDALDGTALGQGPFVKLAMKQGEVRVLSFAVGQSKKPGLGMWVWPQTAFDTAPAREKLLDFCAQEGIAHLDQHIGIEIGKAGPFLKNADALAALVVTMQEQGITVNALRGSGDMFFESNHAGALRDLQTIIAFDKQLPAGVHLAGVKYDVEPYSTEEWKAGGAKRTKVMLDYLSFLRKAKGVLQKEAPHMALSVDVPFWWDAKEFAINFEGHEKLFVHHIQDLTDYIAIMSYRPDAKQVLDCIQQELAYAAEIGKRVCPGLETGELKGKESWISFWGKPPAVFRKSVGELQQALSGNKGASCIMLHHYSSLVEYLNDAL